MRARPPRSGGRPSAVYFSPVQIIALLILILLFLLSYVLMPSEFNQPPSLSAFLFAFFYIVALLALSVLLAWAIVKTYRQIQKHSKQKQGH